MKPTKKKPAKKTTAKRAVRRGSIEHKLIQLKNRIDEAFHGGEHKEDLTWVNFQLNLIRDGKTLNTMNMRRANELWRAYA